MIKPRSLVERYLRFIEREAPRTIVELGVREGGSTALLVLASDADVILAVDLEPDEPPALTHFGSLGLAGDRLLTRFGVDQGDRDTLRSVVVDALGGAPIDLLIDDASHRYGPSRASFETLFPLVRPGGVYIVEDWAADLQIADRVGCHVEPGTPEFVEREHLIRALVYRLNQPGFEISERLLTRMRDVEVAEPTAARHPNSNFSAVMRWIVDAVSLVPIEDLHAELGEGVTVDDRPMPDLGMELALLAAARRDVVAETLVEYETISVRRGLAELDPSSFRIEHHLPDPYGYLRP